MPPFHWAPVRDGDTVARDTDIGRLSALLFGFWMSIRIGRHSIELLHAGALAAGRIFAYRASDLRRHTPVIDYCDEKLLAC